MRYSPGWQAMRWLWRACAAVLLAWPLIAIAADPVGKWRVDRASIEAIADRMAEAMATRVTPEQLAEMRAAMHEMQAQIEALRASNPALAAQMEEMMGRVAGMSDDPIAAVRQSMIGLLVANASDATLVFTDDGAVTIEDPADQGPDPMRWRWRMEGAEVELIGTDPDDPSATYVLRGPLDGERITLRLVMTDTLRDAMADEPGFAETLGELEYVLLRQ